MHAVDTLALICSLQASAHAKAYRVRFEHSRPAHVAGAHRRTRMFQHFQHWGRVGIRGARAGVQDQRGAGGGQRGLPGGGGPWRRPQVPPARPAQARPTGRQGGQEAAQVPAGALRRCCSQWELVHQLPLSPALNAQRVCGHSLRHPDFAASACCKRGHKLEKPCAYLPFWNALAKIVSSRAILAAQRCATVYQGMLCSAAGLCDGNISRLCCQAFSFSSLPRSRSTLGSFQAGSSLLPCTAGGKLF